MLSRRHRRRLVVLLMVIRRTDNAGIAIRVVAVCTGV
jgi:hypothetical protein